MRTAALLGLMCTRFESTPLSNLGAAPTQQCWIKSLVQKCLKKVNDFIFMPLDVLVFKTTSTAQIPSPGAVNKNIRTTIASLIIVDLPVQTIL